MEPGRKLHEFVTGCDDLWDGLDGVEKQIWAESEDEIIQFRLFENTVHIPLKAGDL